MKFLRQLLTAATTTFAFDYTLQTSPVLMDGLNDHSDGKNDSISFSNAWTCNGGKRVAGRRYIAKGANPTAQFFITSSIHLIVDSI